MSAASNDPGEGLTTEQIAAAGARPVPGPPGAARTQPGAQAARPAQRPASAAVAGPSEGNGLATGEPRARLLEGDELQGIVSRWKEIQAHFVDEPRMAVEQADALVAGLMQQLAAMFARQRAELEQRWASGDGVSTEELRQSLRHYRSFFERLLAA